MQAERRIHSKWLLWKGGSVGTLSSRIVYSLRQDPESSRLESQEKLNGDIDKDVVGQRLEETYKRIEFIDAYSAKSRAGSVLVDLGFTPRMRHRATRKPFLKVGKRELLLLVHRV